MIAVGMAIGISENIYGKKKEEQEIIIQTGLPTAYIAKDKNQL